MSRTHIVDIASPRTGAGLPRRGDAGGFLRNGKNSIRRLKSARRPGRFMEFRDIPVEPDDRMRNRMTTRLIWISTTAQERIPELLALIEPLVPSGGQRTPGGRIVARTTIDQLIVNSPLPRACGNTGSTTGPRAPLTAKRVGDPAGYVVASPGLQGIRRPRRICGNSPGQPDPGACQGVA